MRIDVNNVPSQRLSLRKVGEGERSEEVAEYRQVADSSSRTAGASAEESVDKVEFSSRSTDAPDDSMARYRAAAAALQRRMTAESYEAQNTREDVFVGRPETEEGSSIAETA